MFQIGGLNMLLPPAIGRKPLGYFTTILHIEGFFEGEIDIQLGFQVEQDKKRAPLVRCSFAYKLAYEAKPKRGFPQSGLDSYRHPHSLNKHCYHQRNHCPLHLNYPART